MLGPKQNSAEGITIKQLRVFNPGLSTQHGKVVGVKVQKAKVQIVIDSNMNVMVTQKMPQITWDVYSTRMTVDPQFVELKFFIEALAPLGLQNYLMLEFFNTNLCKKVMSDLQFNKDECDD